MKIIELEGRGKLSYYVHHNSKFVLVKSLRRISVIPRKLQFISRENLGRLVLLDLWIFRSKYVLSSEAVVQRCFVKPEACNFIKKETLAQVFFYEFCEIFKNTFFIELPCAYFCISL